MMAECCKKYLGEFPHNKDIDTKIIAAIAGTFIIRLDFGSSKLEKEIDLDAGDKIVIPRPFNENYLYNFTIEDPNGDLVEIEECTNFSLKTYIGINDECPTDDCDDSSVDSIEYY